MPYGVHIDFFGIARGGNHAVIHWLCAQAGKHKFFNYMNLPSNRNQDVRSSCDLDCRLLSWEDIPFKTIVPEHAEKTWPDAADHAMVCLLRDPFNLMASRLKQTQNGSGAGIDTGKGCVECWKSYARAFVSGVKVNRQLVWVLYNKWCVNSTYRRTTVEAFGFCFNADRDAASRARVVNPGSGGSSFDRMAFDGRAGEMKVFDRWKHYAGDKRFVALFDEETKDLSRAIFDFCPL